MQLIPLEKVYSNRDSIRKAREAFLISKDRTLLPHGLNIREEIYCFFFFLLLLFFIFYFLLLLFHLFHILYSQSL